MQKFDLKEGDLVSYTEKVYDESSKKNWSARKKISKTTTYKIDKVYSFIFTCHDFEGHRTSFTKADYLSGEVKRIER